MDIFDTAVAILTSISGHDDSQEKVAQRSVRLLNKQQKTSVFITTDIVGTLVKALIAYCIFIALPKEGASIVIAAWLCYCAWKSYEPRIVVSVEKNHNSYFAASIPIIKNDISANLGGAVIVAAFVHNDLSALITALAISFPLVLYLRYRSHKNWKGEEHLASRPFSRFSRFGLLLLKKTQQFLNSNLWRGSCRKARESLMTLSKNTSSKKFFGFIVYGIFTWTAAYVLLGEPLLTPRFYTLSEDERLVVSFVIEFFSFAPIVLPWFYKNVIKK